MDRLTAEVEVEGMGKHKEAFIVSVSSVCLYLHVAFLKQLPVLTILQACLNEDSIEVCWKVLTADYLTDEVNIGLEISSCAHLVSNLVDLIDLLPLDVLQRLILDEVFIVTFAPEVIFLVWVKLGQSLSSFVLAGQVLSSSVHDSFLFETLRLRHN